LCINSLFLLIRTAKGNCCRFQYISVLPLLVNTNVCAEEINLAVSNATTGPVSQLGLRLNQGANVYFNKINKLGGIAGASINIIYLDDGYEPYNTYQNTLHFLKRNDVFAFFNFIGTPTTYAVINKVSASNIPFITPYTGAEFLRKPIINNVFNLRASYYQEAEQQINYLINTREVTKIGLLVQADKFGRSVEKGYLQAMQKRGVKPVVTTRYRRNSQDINLALSILQEKNVEAIAFVGTYEPLAGLINLAFKHNYKPIFTTVSFISSQDLFSRIKQPSDVLVTEVVVDPRTCIKEICQQFVHDMKKQGITEVDRVQFEGYLNALLFVEVAQQCSSQLTQACFMEKISKFQYDEKGLSISFRNNSHQGFSEVFLNSYLKP
jgi:ABC-type branched-subunit amino acid transport system substrate-binding protein